MVQCAASALCERNQAFLLVMFLIVVVTNALIFRSIRYGVETFTLGGGGVEGQGCKSHLEN